MDRLPTDLGGTYPTVFEALDVNERIMLRLRGT